jgi:hypothetical protein
MDIFLYLCGICNTYLVWYVHCVYVFMFYRMHAYLNVTLHVQVGDEATQEEMLMMCDTPTQQHFYKVNTYDQLKMLKDRLLEALCEGKQPFPIFYNF